MERISLQTSTQEITRQTTPIPSNIGLPIGVGTSYHTVIVKFLFTNPKWIPAGIPFVSRGTNNLEDNAHFRKAVEMFGAKAGQKLGAIGRVREGRVDTGIHIADNIQLSQPAMLRSGLANIGMPLVDSHYFPLKSEDPKKSDKWVVCLSFCVSQERIELPGPTVQAMRELAKTTWQWTHVWANPDGKVTINVGGRLPEGKPRYAMVICNRKFAMARIIEPVTEEQEGNAATAPAE